MSFSLKKKRPRSKATIMFMVILFSRVFQKEYETEMRYTLIRYCIKLEIRLLVMFYQ